MYTVASGTGTWAIPGAGIFGVTVPCKAGRRRWSPGRSHIRWSLKKDQVRAWDSGEMSGHSWAQFQFLQANTPLPSFEKDSYWTWEERGDKTGTGNQAGGRESFGRKPKWILGIHSRWWDSSNLSTPFDRIQTLGIRNRNRIYVS